MCELQSVQPIGGRVLVMVLYSVVSIVQCDSVFSSVAVCSTV
jgi:hypothetical protein